MMRTKMIWLAVLIIALGVWSGSALGQPAAAPPEVLRCAAFSPYVGVYNPNTGPHPPPALIDELLEAQVQRLGFRCIMTYGMLNGLDATFAAAQSRGVKVIAIIWLDSDPAVNAASIAAGILNAKLYPDTIFRLACGSEVRTRLGAAVAEPIIRDCISQVKAAGVTQPVTSIDTWWGWCNEAWPCQAWSLAADVDWIGANIFPWWENKYSGLFPCTPATAAADFHLARLQDLAARYPDKPVMMTEFGWPAGPDGYTETNLYYPDDKCGVASEANQRLVVEQTLAKLEQAAQNGSLFETFREAWKSAAEGAVGPYWGVCQGSPPYTCAAPYGMEHRLYLPVLNK